MHKQIIVNDTRNDIQNIISTYISLLILSGMTYNTKFLHRFVYLFQSTKFIN